MDLPQIGEHCALPQCNVLDFLPIQCPSCNAIFCRHHISMDSHSCFKSDDSDPLPDPTDLPALERCAAHPCAKHALLILDDDRKPTPTCSRCSQYFCPAHRFPDSHSCSGHAVTTSQSQIDTSRARALFTKTFPQKNSSENPSALRKKTQQSKSPAKLAALKKVQLMKMKHQAQPADPRDKASSVGVERRLHLQVRSEGVPEKPFWIRKDVIAGKAVDLFRAQMHLPVRPMCLQLVTEDETKELTNEKELDLQVEDGATVCLVDLTPAATSP